MTSHLKFLSLIFLALTLFSAEAGAKSKDKGAYVYGFALSFNDSTVYITDIEYLPTARVIGKAKFLYGRDNYSYQLRTYLSNKGMANPTCITSFSTKKKDAEKAYLKLRKRYNAQNGFLVKDITPNEFKYEPVEIDDEAVEKAKEQEKIERQKAKEARKKAKKEKKDDERDMKRPPMDGNPGGPEGGMR